MSPGNSTSASLEGKSDAEGKKLAAAAPGPGSEPATTHGGGPGPGRFDVAASAKPPSGDGSAGSPAAAAASTRPATSSPGSDDASTADENLVPTAKEFLVRMQAARAGFVENLERGRFDEATLERAKKSDQNVAKLARRLQLAIDENARLEAEHAEIEKMLIEQSGLKEEYNELEGKMERLRGKFDKLNVPTGENDKSDEKDERDERDESDENAADNKRRVWAQRCRAERAIQFSLNMPPGGSDESDERDESDENLITAHERFETTISNSDREFEAKIEELDDKESRLIERLRGNFAIVANERLETAIDNSDRESEAEIEEPDDEESRLVERLRWKFAKFV